MATTLTAFENLKENVKDSLNSQEKTDLRALSTTEVRSQKEEIGKKSFSVGGKTMKLKDIVANLDFDTKGNIAKVKIEEGKFVTIGWQSELGAAIQVYAIANNKSIGNAGIDGKVGKDTIKGLQSTQNAIKTETGSGNSTNDAEKNEDKDNKLDKVRDIFEKNLYEDFGKDRDTYLNSYKIFDADKCLTGGFVDTARTKIRIDYDSQQDRTQHKISVEIPITENTGIQDNYGRVNKDKLIKSIKDAIKNNEHLLREERLETAVKNGIDSYNEASIADPLIKEWFKIQKNPDFKVQRIYKIDGDGYYAVINNTKDTKGIRKEREIKFKNILNSNGNFDAGKYAGELVKIYKPQAIKRAKTDIKTQQQDVANSSIETKITVNKNAIDKIDGYGNKYAGEFTKEKRETNNQINYLEKLKVLNEVKNTINDPSKDTMTKLDALKKVVKVTEVRTDNGMTVQQLDYGTETRKIFKAVNKEDEYLSTVSDLATKVLPTRIEINK